MTKDTKTKEEKDKDEKDSPDGDIPNGLNSPQVDEKTGKPTRKAITSFKQAHSIAKHIYDKSKDGRIAVAAIIMRKYGGEAPYGHEALERTGQTWRNNYSTNPLASVVDRSKPQLSDPIKQAFSLTYSSLPKDDEGAAIKTREFRDRTTKLIRSWSGWVDFTDQCSQEVYLFGNFLPGWLDDNWRPTSWGFDEAFLPEGSGQHASKFQIVVFRQPILLHDFLQKLGDKEAMEAADFNLEGCVKAANEAAGRRNNSDPSELEKADAEREQGTMGETYESDTKVIWQFHVLVREYATNKVDLWTVEQKNGYNIRHVEGLFESMEDACTAFTLQSGNRKFYGSKGAGRLLTNLHIGIDRGRCLAADQVYLDGLPILQADNPEETQVHVRHPFLVVGKDVTVTKESVQFDSQAFEYMDSNLVRIMESIAGAFIPPKIDEGSAPNTKIEAAQRAERELAVRNGVLGRHIGQYADLIGAMQRKIYSTENLKEGLRIWKEKKEKAEKGIKVIAKKIFDWIKGTSKNAKIEPIKQSKTSDPEAVEAIIDLLDKGLTVEEIATLALSPAGNNSQEQASTDIAARTAYLETQVQNPFIDQKERAAMVARDQLGEDAAKQILLADQEDPNVEAIAARQQIVEWLVLVDGQEVPVASTDHHRIHKEVLMSKVMPMFEAVKQGNLTPEIVLPASMALKHLISHHSMDLQMTPEDRLKEEQILTELQGLMEQAGKAMQKQAEEAAKLGLDPSQMPPPVNGQPVQATGPNGAMDPNGELDKAKLTADVELRRGDQDIEHRKLDIKEKELNMKDEHQTTTMVTDAMQKVAEEAAKSQREGMVDASNELAAQNQRTDENSQTK